MKLNSTRKCPTLQAYQDKEVLCPLTCLKDFNVESYAGSVELYWGKLGETETKKNDKVELISE